MTDLDKYDLIHQAYMALITIPLDEFPPELIRSVENACGGLQDLYQYYLDKTRLNNANPK